MGRGWVICAIAGAGGAGVDKGDSSGLELGRRCLVVGVERGATIAARCVCCRCNEDDPPQEGLVAKSLCGGGHPQKLCLHTASGSFRPEAEQHHRYHGARSFASYL